MIGRTALMMGDIVVAYYASPLFKGERFALVWEGSLGPKLGRGIAVLLSAQ